MYEVEFILGDTERLHKCFTTARVSTEGLDMDALRGRVLNAIGEAPATSMGSSPSYDAGARGPTNRPNVFSPQRVALTFSGYIVKGDNLASRHYLTQNDVTFFERLAKVYAKRPDFAPLLTIGMKIRRLLEENEPDDANAVDASNLYSAIVEYPKIVVVDAGGNTGGYAISVDVLVRPDETRVENYGEGDG